MRSSLEKLLIIPDTHRPYHDVAGVDLMLQVARDFRPERIIVLGDYCDFYKVSAHRKDPSRILSLDDELADVNRGLDALDALGARNKHFIAGNHEDRLTRYMQDRAPELHSLISIPDLFRLKKRGWTYTPYRANFVLGHCYYTHDVEYAGRHSVYQCLDVFQHTNVTGHTHRMGYVVEGNAAGDAKLSAQFGWLGDVHQVDYKHQARAKKDWALGFGLGYYDAKTGANYLTPVPLVQSKGRLSCVVGGKRYQRSRG